MHRPRAADWHHGVGINALGLFQRMDRRRLRHIAIDGFMNGPGGFRHRKTKRLADMFGQRCLSRRDIQLHRATQEAFSAQITQHQIRIRDRGPRAAKPVAGGAGIGTRTFRADTHQTEAIHARDGTAAGADFDHVNDRHLER